MYMHPWAAVPLVAAVSLCAGELRVGRATLKIMPGGEAQVRALVLESGGIKAVLVACDVDTVDSSLAAEARNRVAGQTGIPVAHVMIHATRAGGESRKLRSVVAVRAGEAAKAADATLAEARARRGAGREDSIVFYRRYLMKDGTVRSGPPKRLADIVQPAGDPDPEVAVIQFENMQGKPLATYLNYGLAAPGAETYPSSLGAVLARLCGPGMVALFGPGASANVDHLDIRNGELQKGPAEAQRLGTILAGEAIKALARARPIDATPITVRREMLRLPGARGSTEVEVQVITLGEELAWVALPGDVFVELGLAIKKASPFPQTMIVTLANGSVGVIPTKKAFSEGGEEVAKAACGVGCGELLADAAIRLLVEARRK